ncbi:TPA: hypothetical protein JLP25_003969 [Escherichia coli]|uniref:hypothetical protein n=1 Tax=Escherichia TaxID=561 RepID=UPI0012FF78B0|nr:hypothetical protein [Escherichia coli]EKR5145723.1 hypothetical protein [Escherichia coli]ELD1746211.1 hypothetical protein [Escherichia coli]ELO4849570.1 hypothetical protein [Escherichia coli]ELO5051213.1 hypothetical protein [Escherichia coli]
MQTVSATFLGFPAATMRASKRKLASSIGYNHFLKVKIEKCVLCKQHQKSGREIPNTKYKTIFFSKLKANQIHAKNVKNTPKCDQKSPE